MIAEETMLRVASQVLAPDDVVLEAGGNEGELAAALAPRCAWLWSMEADPERYPILDARLRSFPNAMAVQGALTAWSAGSQVEFHLDPYRPGSSLLPLIERSEDGTIVVRAFSADQFIQAHGITALVLDIERYEYVLLPQLYALRELRAVVVEWHPEGTTEQIRMIAEVMLKYSGLDKIAHDASIPQFPVSGYVRKS